MLKVLIVDDDPTTVKLLRKLLELDGFEVYSAATGAEVMSRASQVAPDIILMDYRLTDTDGVAVVRALRASAQFAHTPIVIVSGVNVEQEALAAGANHFLIKPFDPAGLRPLLNNLIAG